MNSRSNVGAVNSVLLHKLFCYESYIFLTLLISKCLPILSYELDCLILDARNLDSISKTWNIAFCWLFRLGELESSKLLFLQCKAKS